MTVTRACILDDDFTTMEARDSFGECQFLYARVPRAHMFVFLLSGGTTSLVQRPPVSLHRWYLQLRHVRPDRERPACGDSYSTR